MREGADSRCELEDCALLTTINKQAANELYRVSNVGNQEALMMERVEMARLNDNNLIQ